MGISSHQVRLLQLTDRKHTIGRELNRLANDKMDLTRDMSKASKKYQEALSSKVLKWSSNSGVSYVDLSYNNLMKPSQMNGNTAYILTDSSDKVVIDYNYKKYAEMISANGAPGGDWEGNRSKILSELVGVPEATINGVDASSAKVQSALEKLNSVKAKEPSMDGFKKTSDLCCILEEKVGSTLGSEHASFKDAKIKSWADAYQHGGKINLGSNDPHNVLSNVASNLANSLADVFVAPPDFDPENSPVYDAINSIVTTQEAVIDNQKNSKMLTKEGNDYVLDVQQFVNDIMNYLSSYIDCSETSNNYKIEYYDTEDPAYGKYLADKEAWDKELSEAQAQYDAALGADNALLTAEQEKQISFYDELFSTIAEKGWTYNGSVDNDDYLNQMLQNGIYTLTTVDRNKVEDPTTITEDYYWENTYNTDIATNYTNIFAVNDSEARDEAQVEYEKTKSIINEKETKVDVKMQNLKTEQEAINTMIQSIQSMIDENIESSFGIFA